MRQGGLIGRYIAKQLLFHMAPQLMTYATSVALHQHVHRYTATLFAVHVQHNLYLQLVSIIANVRKVPLLSRRPMYKCLFLEILSVNIS